MPDLYYTILLIILMISLFYLFCLMTSCSYIRFDGFISAFTLELPLKYYALLLVVTYNAIYNDIGY